MYYELCTAVEKGVKFSIDFKKRTLKVNGKLIDLGKIEWLKEDDHILETIERLYEDYKYSVPSERSEKRQRTYFKALKYEDLTDENMLHGERREYARFILELYVLMSIVRGFLSWKEEWGSWFWQSEKDKDLVILREWVEPKQDK